MPIVDNDKLFFRQAARDGSTNIRVEVTWTDGITGENKGTYGLSWSTADEFKAWLEQQNFEDLMRGALLACLNRDTGALRPAVFDALPGKTLQVQVKTTQVQA